MKNPSETAAKQGTVFFIMRACVRIVSTTSSSEQTTLTIVALETASKLHSPSPPSRQDKITDGYVDIIHNEKTSTTRATSQYVTITGLRIGKAV